MQPILAASTSHPSPPMPDIVGSTVHTRGTEPPTSPPKLYILDMGITSAVHQGTTSPNGRIMKCSSDGQNMQTIVHGLHSMPDSLAIDVENHHIYYTNAGWASLNNGFISRVDMDGQNNTIVIPQGITWTPKQLALDLTVIPQKLYWSDRDGMRILRSNLDGTQIEILFQAGDGEEDRANPRNWCVGLAVDTQRRVMYWTQSGPERGYQGRLLRARLDLIPGENAFNRMDVQVLLDNLPEPIQLYLRIGTNTLYMTDRGDPRFGSTITEVRMGKRPLRKVIRIRRRHEAIAMTMDDQDGKIYFTDLTGSLYSTNPDGSEAEILLQNSGELTGIASVRE